MVLNRKGFFLELGDPEPKAAKTKPQPNEVKIENTPEASQPAAASVPVEELVPGSAPVAVASESQTDSTAESNEITTKAESSQTTAEAIAAELAAAEAAKPEVQLITFAPKALQPGNSIRPDKRRPGNNLTGFRSMASELFKS